MTTPDDIVRRIIVGRNVAWQLKLDQFTDEALVELQRSVRKATKETVNYIESLGEKATEWTVDRSEKVLESLDNLTKGIQTALSQDIGVVSSVAGQESFREHNDILSFGGRVARFNFVMPSGSQLKSLVMNTPVGGALLSDWVKMSFDYELQERIRREILSGVLKGESYRKLAKRIEEGFSDLSRREVVTLTRTYVQSANVGAMETVYKANEDIVKKVRWSATLESGYSKSGRGTCIRCAVLDGTLFPLSDHPPCPLHPRCLIDGQIPIYTSNGWKPISKINVGDLVLTHKRRFRRVTELIFTPNQKTDVVRLSVEFGSRKESLTLTGDHPVFSGKKWVLAKDITIGDTIEFLGSDGKYKFVELQVLDVKKWTLKHGRTLYNFSVEEDESYVAKGFVVHNCRCHLLPQTVSFRELGLDIDEITTAYRPFTIRPPETIGVGRRRKILEVGFRKGDYEDWFYSRGPRFQQNVVGPIRYKLIKEGEIKFGDLVEKKTGKLKTLSELGYNRAGRKKLSRG